MNEQETGKTIWQSVIESASRIMAHLKPDTSIARAQSARWRHSLGRPMGEDPLLYGEFLEQLDSHIRPGSGAVSPAEESVWLAVQMYVVSGKLNQNGVSLGKACGQTRDDNIHRRLIIVESAQEFSQLTEPLRALVQLLSSGENRIALDYAALAGDLYSWHYDPMSVVRRWEQDYVYDR